MFEFLEKSENNKFLIFVKYIFPVIFLVMEYITHKKYWKKIILPELIENEEIFDFLDRNDFALEEYNNYLVKKDFINSNERLSVISKNEAKIEIQKEFVLKFSELIEKNCNQNIEDLMALEVNIETFLIKNNGEYLRDTIYIVKIQFIRYQYLKKIFKIFLVWLLIITLLALTILLSNYII